MTDRPTPTLNRALTLALVAAAFVLGLAALAWACTFPVGHTQGTPAASKSGSPASEASTVVATGEVVHAAEDQSNCSGPGTSPTTMDCEYRFGIVNPNNLGSGAITPADPSCHYDTQESDNPAEFQSFPASPVPSPPPSTPGATVLKANGSGPSGNPQLGPNDDSGASMGTGPTLMCFYTSDSPFSSGDTEHLNNNRDGAAAATVPQPFVVLP